MDKLAIIKLDRMKYKSNSLSATFCLLSIVFNACYFIVVYKINHINVYTALLGLSVIVNLAFMLAVFMTYTKIKVYDKIFSYVALALAVMQVVRLFIFPIYSIQSINGMVAASSDEFNFMYIWLLLSSACLVAAGVIGLILTARRTKYLTAVENGEIDISFLSVAE